MANEIYKYSKWFITLISTYHVLHLSTLGRFLSLKMLIESKINVFGFDYMQLISIVNYQLRLEQVQ